MWKLGQGSEAVKEELDEETGAITSPIYQTTAFAYPQGEKFRYSREVNPTVTRLNRIIANLEKAQAGMSFSSGMGAISSSIFALVKPGTGFVIPSDVFGRSLKFAREFLYAWGVNVKISDPGTRSLVEKSAEIKNGVIFMETITNPLLRVPDIREISKVGKENGSLVVADSTFATPINMNPLEYGATLVLHSASKFIGGHNDVIAGLAAGPESLIDRIDQTRRTLGTSLDPHTAYLVIRGIKTLKIRMDVINKNAMEIAEFLEDHPKVKKVHYPGLPSHEDHKIAREILRGYGGVVSFEIRGGTSSALELMRRFKLIIPAQTLGGANSVISHPPTMSHRSLSLEDRKRVGIDEGLMRLSVGIEDVEDLKRDLSEALANI